MKDRYAPEIREKLLRCLAYEPKSGLLWWKESPSKYRKTRKGSVAGARTKAGHLRVGIGVNGKRKVLWGTHVIWLVQTGDWHPEGFMIDHANGDPSDDRWLNLRLATPAQNAFNRKSAHPKYRELPTGVTVHNSRSADGKQFVSRMWDGNLQKKIHLGVFFTAEEAREAYELACISLKGEFSYYNRR